MLHLQTVELVMTTLKKRKAKKVIKSKIVRRKRLWSTYEMPFLFDDRYISKVRNLVNGGC